ncbi:MAG: protein kinase [Lentisphaeraceae bacterium]|nr:protein kinase [Lentisphaeraceae bacterium]
MSSNSFKLEPGNTISHFRLEKLLGEGGMGAVYLAEDLTLSRRVAIKFMRRSMLATLPNPEIRKKVEGRFIREAKSAASINHPNIAQIYEADFETDHWYIAMEFIDGKPLDEILTKDGPFKPKKALDIITQVSHGLEYAWDSYKIIHRDIKPQNLMFSKRGHVKIVDLGLAKPIIESGEEELELTGAGVPVGTPYYMAPEQAAGGTVNHQTDIFALGATIYELLCGKKCFQGKTPPMIYNKQINKDYIPLTEFGIDEKISNLIDRMLEPEQSKRIDNYDALIEEVEILKDGKARDRAVASMDTIDDSRTAVSHTVGDEDVDLAMMMTVDDSNLNTSMATSMFGTVITGTPVDDMKTMVDVFYPVDFKILDRYRILKVIGRGNSGIVYHCMDTQLERECSVKSVVSGREYPVQIFPRIKKNYIKMSSRKHPNLVEVYDVQVNEGGNEVFIIMELLKGKNLLQHTNSLSHLNENVSISSVEPILTKIAKALDSVSREFQIVHNDLKPVSIYIVENDEIKILDYGVTYLTQEDDPHSGNPEIWKYPIANPDYMSPELWQHKKPNMAADQYSLAVIIYEMLSHKLPFWMKEMQSTIEQDDNYILNLLERQYDRVLTEAPAPIDYLDKNQNKALSKALAKSPQQRFSSCEAFISTLAGKSTKQSVNPALIAAAIILIGAGVAGFVIFNKGKDLKLEADALNKECLELVEKFRGHGDTSEIDSLLTSAKQAYDSKDYNKASETFKSLQSKINDKIKTKKTEFIQNLDSKKVAFTKLSTEAEKLGKINESVKKKKESVKFPSYQEKASLKELSTAIASAENANIQLKKIIDDGSKSLAQLKEKVSKELISLNNNWQAINNEPGTADQKKIFQDKIAKGQEALKKNDINAAETFKTEAAKIYQATSATVNDRFKTAIQKLKTDYSKLKEATKPILFFLENSTNTFTKIEQRDSIWIQAENDMQFKQAAAHLETQVKDLTQLKTQLETTAKQTFIRNINNKKIDCLTKRSELDSFKDLIKDFPSLEADFNNADSLLKRTDYKSAKNEYDRLEAKLKTMQNELDTELKVRVNDLHTKVVGISSTLEKYKEINPGISLKIDDFDINFQVVRAKKSENKYRAAFGEYQKLFTMGSKLIEEIKTLTTPVLGKDWSVPVLNIKFTWIKEMNLWVGTHELTNGEFRKFKPEFKNKSYQGIGTMNGDRQPVGMVTFRDAMNYCKWLTVNAREKGELPKGYVYRLPTGLEWKKFATSGKTSKYPWGDKWPPAFKINIGSKGVVKGVNPEWDDYTDDFPLTSPVEKSGKNPWGLYGCSGNVWEWTLDAEGNKRAVYGGSWNSMQKFPLHTDLEGQNMAPETAFNDDVGFRVILAPPVTN